MAKTKNAPAKGTPAAAPTRLRTRSDLGEEATRDISAGLGGLLADTFALYLKTKNFHWHMSGPHFRDFHLLLDEHADQIFAMTDPMAERARKIGGTTLRSIGDIARRQRIKDNDADYVEPQDMMAELAEDNRTLAAAMRVLHGTCDDYGDVATASLLETVDRRRRAPRLVPLRDHPRRSQHQLLRAARSEAHAFRAMAPAAPRPVRAHQAWGFDDGKRNGEATWTTGSSATAARWFRRSASAR